MKSNKSISNLLLAFVTFLSFLNTSCSSGSSPNVPGEENQEEIAFSPNSLNGVTSWYRSSSLASSLGQHEALVDWLNQADAKDWNSAVSVGGAGTFYQDPLSTGFPSVFVCGTGYVTSPCVGSGNARGTQLRLASNMANHKVWLGLDAVAASVTGGSSYTVVTVAARTNANKTPIVFNRDGVAAPGKGIFLGWLDNTTLKFSSTGQNGGVSATIPAFSVPSKQILVGRFSRTAGHDLWLDGVRVASNSTALDGGDLTNTIIPTIGFRNGGSGYGFHLFEYIEVQRALTDAELCELHQYLNETYKLNLSITCS